MSKHLSGVMAALLAAAMLLTAPATADHRPGNVVVMGGTVSLTGRYVVPAERTLNGRKLYVEELNARGGLLGHRVELKIYDDKTDARTAVELYGKLITEDKVDLVLGPYSSYLSDAVANVMERYKQPFVLHGTKSAIYQRGRKYIFSLPTPYAPDRAKAALHAAKRIGVKRIALISRATPTALEKFVGAQQWAKKLGLKVVLSERYPKKQTDFTQYLQRIRTSGAEAIIADGSDIHIVAQLRQLRELNINVKMFAEVRGAASFPKFIEELGSTAEYVVGYASWLPKPVLGHPGIKKFIENYKKRYGEQPNYHASEGYAGMQITEAAVREAGSFDPEKIRAALATIPVYTIRGPYKANERGMSTPIEPLAFQIRNGERLIVWPARFSEAKVVAMPKWEERAKK